MFYYVVFSMSTAQYVFYEIIRLINYGASKTDLNDYIFTFFCNINVSYLAVFAALWKVWVQVPKIPGYSIFSLGTGSDSPSNILNASHNERRLLAFTKSVENSVEEEIFISRIKSFARIAMHVVLLNYILTVICASEAAFKQYYLSSDNEFLFSAIYVLQFVTFSSSEAILIINPIFFNLRFWRKTQHVYKKNVYSQHLTQRTTNNNESTSL